MTIMEEFAQSAGGVISLMFDHPDLFSLITPDF
jgi:hypothetical protein